MKTGENTGIYMKHLLNHIRRKDLDIERVFKNVQTDFQKLTAASISERMKPEYRSSLGQEMYLGANLRQRKTNVLQKAFFRLTRCDYLFSPFSPQSTSGKFEFQMGIKWNQDDTNLSWVHGQVSGKNLYLLFRFCVSKSPASKTLILTIFEREFCLKWDQKV